MSVVTFDEQYYLAQNPDVAAAIQAGFFTSALQHFQQFGDKEGRNPNSVFNATEYLAANPDVAAAVQSGAFDSAWDHYITFGFNENRAPNAALASFNSEAYLAANPDVAAAVQSGAFSSALEHYLLFGQTEQRPVQPATAEYTLTPAASSAAEGTTVTFDLATKYLPAGSTVTLLVEGLSESEVVGGLTREVTVDAEGKATVAIELTADSVLQGDRTLTVKVADTDVTSPGVTVTDAVPVYTITAAPADAVDEGAAVTFEIATQYLPEGTTLPYTLTGVQADDVDGGLLTGTATVGADGKAYVTVNLLADQKTEGAETLTLTLDNLGTASSVTVNDTSVNGAPAIANVETTPVLGGSPNALTATATVVDANDNFNGGSITIDVNGGAYILENGALSFAGGSPFSIIGNQIVADPSIIEGDEALVIGTFTTAGSTDLDTDAADTTLGINKITIALNSDTVTSATVQQMLRDIRITDPTSSGANPAASQAKVTVTVADADGLTGSFSRVVDADGLLTLTGLNDAADSREVQVAGANNISISGGNAVFAASGAPTNGMTVTVASSVNGDVFHFANTTQAIGAAGTVRAIGNQIAYTANGTSETIIGTFTGGTAGQPLAITLNGQATDTSISALLNGIQTNLAAGTLGARSITTSVVTPDGLTVLTGQDALSSTLTLVGNFSNTALTATPLSTVLGGSVASPYTINQNLYVDLSGTYAAADVAQLIADGKLVVTGTPVIRFVTSGTADLTAVENLDALGAYSFGSAAEPIDENLTVTAAQANGHKGVVDADTITVVDVEDTLGADLSGLTSVNGGAVAAFVDTGAGVTFTGTLGAATLTVDNSGSNGTGNLTVAADKASAKTITNAVSNTVVTGLDGAAAYDISGLTNGAGAGKTVVNFTANTTLDPATNLASPDLAATVAQNTTLTLTNVQAAAVYAADAAARITGANATGTGNKGGSITVTLVDGNTATAGVQAGAIDLRALAGGGIAVGAESATAGKVTVAVTEDTTLDSSTNFTLASGTAEVQVAAGKTLTGEAEDLVTANVTGAGNVTAVLSTAAADLSTIAATGTKQATVAAGLPVVLNGATNLGTFSVSVAENAGLILTAAQAAGKTITGAATTADSLPGFGGSIGVTGLSTTAVDLSKITAGAASEAGDTAGVLLVEASGDLDDTTNLGTFRVNINDGDTTAAEAVTLTLTEAQATGRSIVNVDNAAGTIGDLLNLVNYADTGSLIVKGLTATTDLTGVTIGGTLRVDVASSVDVSGNSKLGATAAGGTTYALTDATVTMTAAQASGKLFLGLDGNDAGTDISSALSIAGDLADNQTLTLVNTTTGASNLTDTALNFGADNTIAVDATSVLNVGAANLAAGQTVTGAGTVNVYGLGATTNLSGVTATTVNAVVTSSVNVSANSNLGTVDAYQIADGQTLTLSLAQASGKVIDKVAGGTTGAASITGTGGDDTLNMSTSNANLTITLNTGDDTVIGGSGNDSINGGNGQDVIRAGGGNDTVNLTEGTLASDTIVFEATATANGSDTILGFTAGTGGDVLDLSAFLSGGTLLDAGTAVSGTIEETVADAGAGTNIANSVLFLDVADYANIAAFQAATENVAGAGLFGLADGAKAVVVLGDMDSANTSLSVYYVTGGAANAETVELVGTLQGVNATGFVAGNFAFTPTIV